MIVYNKSVGVTPFYLRGELVTPTKMLSADISTEWKNP